ncbi:MAG: M48 family metallopeptidase [Deltaproteobacteria bacterium]|jgi:predicted Zn-dependent protease|nr:M48 family metallopeptidase [Deltaproteobacteria bacterium]
MINFNKISKLFLVIALTYLLAACSPVIGTGRSQLNLVSDAEINEMAAAQYSELLKESHLSSDRKKSSLIKKVGARISQAAKRMMDEYGRSQEIDNFKWEFNLIDSEEVNAFCMPGGKVAFYTGILDVCESEAGIAAVMGHEVAHALARHGNERVSQQMMAGLGGNLLNIGLQLGGVSTGTYELAMTAFTLGAQYGVLLPYSRAHESEADRLGMVLMSMAGYDPQEAIDLWVRMGKLSDRGGVPYFLSTHPSDSQRIKNLEKYLPDAKAKFTAYTGK